MGNPDNIFKLEAAEAKLHELKNNTAILGKEATSAMAAVEGQQQRLTLQRIIAMVIKSISPLLLLALRTWPGLAQKWLIVFILFVYFYFDILNIHLYILYIFFYKNLKLLFKGRTCCTKS